MPPMIAAAPAITPTEIFDNRGGSSAAMEGLAEEEMEMEIEALDDSDFVGVMDDVTEMVPVLLADLD